MYKRTVKPGSVLYLCFAMEYQPAKSLFPEPMGPLMAMNSTASVSLDLRQPTASSWQGSSSWVQKTEHHSEAQNSMQIEQSVDVDCCMEKGLSGAITDRVPRLEIGSCSCSSRYINSFHL